MAEEVNRGIALRHVAKLSMQDVLPGIAVTLKELAERSPNSSSRGAIVVEHVEDLGGYAGIEPLDNCEVVLNPLRIIEPRCAGESDMGAQVAASEVKIKQVAPVVIIVGSKIKYDGDERADVGNGVGERHWSSKERRRCRIRDRNKRIMVDRGSGVGDIGGAVLEVAGRRRWRWGGRRHCPRI